MGAPFWVGEFTTDSRDFSGDLEVHWGYGILTHGHMAIGLLGKLKVSKEASDIPNVRVPSARGVGEHSEAWRWLAWGLA